jgi:Fe-S-cluster containining protein
MQADNMFDKSALKRWKEAILKEYPKLTKDDTFKFACHSGLQCFNKCCSDVNIFLTPYDVLRMKRRLGVPSGEFLDRYTQTIILDEKGIPAVLIRMKDDESKTCPFVSPEGCTIYTDRPWSCRMYPLGIATPNRKQTAKDEFYFIVDHFSPCEGFRQDREWTVESWKRDQGADEYAMREKAFQDIMLHDFFLNERKLTLSPRKRSMFFMACYDMDGFRRFLFESTFFERFDVDDETKKRIEVDDEALLEFGYRWVRFGVFGEESQMKIKEDVADKAKKEIEALFTANRGNAPR